MSGEFCPEGLCRRGHCPGGVMQEGALSRWGYVLDLFYIQRSWLSFPWCEIP